MVTANGGLANALVVYAAAMAIAAIAAMLAVRRAAPDARGAAK